MQLLGLLSSNIMLIQNSADAYRDVFIPPLFPQSDLSGVRVLVRIDANVPIMSDGSIRDTFRLDQSLPTLQALIKQGAKIGIISHAESIVTSMAPAGGKGDGSGTPSLLPIFEYLREKVCANCLDTSFVKDIEHFRAALASATTPSLVMLENIREWPGEKKNDTTFARELASCADMYVNDAFSVCHREHASIVGIPKHLPSYAGFLLRSEIEALSRLFTPQHPFVFILGGAKFSTKMPLVEGFIGKADTLFVGGALAHDFLVAAGHGVGKSLVSKEPLDSGRMKAIAGGAGFMLPVDYRIAVAGDSQNKKVVTVGEVGTADVISDSGTATVALLAEKIKQAATVVWNGPLGNYEIGFSESSRAIAEVIATETRRRGVSAQRPDGTFYSVIGGGDTLAVAAPEIATGNAFSFVSTGGGAMLDYLTAGTLPGIEALRK